MWANLGSWIDKMFDGFSYKDSFGAEPKGWSLLDPMQAWRGQMKTLTSKLFAGILDSTQEINENTKLNNIFFKTILF